MSATSTPRRGSPPWRLPSTTGRAGAPSSATTRPGAPAAWPGAKRSARRRCWRMSRRRSIRFARPGRSPSRGSAPAGPGPGSPPPASPSTRRSSITAATSTSIARFPRPAPRSCITATATRWSRSTRRRRSATPIRRSNSTSIRAPTTRSSIPSRRATTRRRPRPRTGAPSPFSRPRRCPTVTGAGAVLPAFPAVTPALSGVQGDAPVSRRPRRSPTQR